MVRLLVKTGPLAGTSIDVMSELLLGREGADVTLDDSEISRRHALVRPADGGLEIEDAGSLNGTWVNGSRIEGVTYLGQGDVIKLGNSSMEVESEPKGSGRTATSGRPDATQRTVAGHLVATGTVADVGQLPGAGTAMAPGPASRAAGPLRPRTGEVHPIESFGAFAPPAPPKRRSPATRRLIPTLLSFAVVIGTAVALVAYFLQ